MVSTTPPKRTQMRRREESQARILDASIKLLVEYGYDRFSIQKVGRSAGCSYELVNHYFGNKEGLLVALAQHIIDKLRADTFRTTELSHGFAGLSQRIRFFTEAAFRDYLTFRAYMIIAAEAPSRPLLSTFVLQVREQTLASLLQALKNAQLAAEIRKDIDTKEYAEMIYDFLRGHANIVLLTYSGELEEAGGRPTRSGSVELFVSLLEHALDPRLETRPHASQKLAPG